MALKAGSVLQLPDLACIGMVDKVGQATLSQKGVYHVLPLTIKGKFAGRDGTFYFIFEPRWFGANFDAHDELLAEGDEGRKKYGMYCRNIAGEGRNSILTSILGDEFESFAGEFDALGDEPEPNAIADVIRKFVQGRDVVYVMKQRVDEGKLTEQYNIASFYPYTQETLNDLVKQSQNEKRKTQLVVTWDED